MLGPGEQVDAAQGEFLQRFGADRTDQSDEHGVGLAIIAAIAHAHRAPLTAGPRLDGGLRITGDFALPRA
ncbi:hypothetical protein GCM10010399_17690 [Dactylosporangium fulvum]